MIELVEALDAVERLARRAVAGADVAAAVGIRQVLGILDGLGRGNERYRTTLAALDGVTTPPPWDPGHLAIGMDTGDADTTRPRPGDAPLAAAARAAVPRALAVLEGVEAAIVRHGRRDGGLDPEGAAAVLAAIRSFDDHCASEGAGIGTV